MKTQNILDRENTSLPTVLELKKVFKIFVFIFLFFLTCIAIWAFLYEAFDLSYYDHIVSGWIFDHL